MIPSWLYQNGRKSPPQEANVADDLFVDGRGHEHLVKVKPVHGWLKDNYCYYIDMELCDFNLFQYIRDEEAVSFRQTNLNYAKRSPSDILDIAAQLLSGVVFIHQRGKVHRDLTPKNSNF